MHLLPRAITPPRAKVVIDRLPGRKVMRHHPPGAPGTHDIADRIHDLSTIPCWATAGLGCGQQGLHLAPFGICEVGAVLFAHGGTPGRQHRTWSFGVRPGTAGRVACSPDVLVSAQGVAHGVLADRFPGQLLPVPTVLPHTRVRMGRDLALQARITYADARGPGG